MTNWLLTISDASRATPLRAHRGLDLSIDNAPQQ
jgi:hypothetical protein